MNDFDFKERIAFSKGYCNEGIERILLDRIPGAEYVDIAHEDDDRYGTDYWVFRNHNIPRLSIDIKVQSRDYGKNCLPLETWSVIDKRIGWTRDPSKRTDYVLWFWIDTKKYCLLPFPILCRVFQKFWIDWKNKYKCAIQDSGSWKSECVFVPIDVIWNKMKDCLINKITDNG